MKENSMEQNQRGDMKITKPPANLEPDRETHSWVWYWDADNYGYLDSVVFF